jgi:hypothetical protein
MQEITSAATAFQSGFSALLQQVPAGGVRDHHFVQVPSDRTPWLDTGIDLAQGEHVSTFSVGRTMLKGTNLSFGSQFQIWCRVGTDGEIFRGTRASNSFTVENSGRLYIGTCFPGEWSTKTGALATPPEVYQGATGDLTLLIVRWATDPLDGLKALAAIGDVDGLVAAEIDRLTNPVPTPEGWEYLWFIGPAEIYRPCHDHGKENAICCHTDNNGALLIKDVVLSLKPDTLLRWAWRMEELPSHTREDTLPTHDYLSVAVEFDNGQDITYYWSSELPVGTTFRCPIPTWTERETHVVVRTGKEELGQWLSEERDVFADYSVSIGGQMPERIVRVWLIAVSIFQQTEGKCQFADISFLTDQGTLTVL